jgi:hypothetical protein
VLQALTCSQHCLHASELLLMQATASPHASDRGQPTDLDLNLSSDVALLAALSTCAL